LAWVQDRWRINMVEPAQARQQMLI